MVSYFIMISTTIIVIINVHGHSFWTTYWGFLKLGNLGFAIAASRFLLEYSIENVTIGLIHVKSVLSTRILHRGFHVLQLIVPELFICLFQNFKIPYSAFFAKRPCTLFFQRRNVEYVINNFQHTSNWCMSILNNGGGCSCLQSTCVTLGQPTIRMWHAIQISWRIAEF